MISNESSAEDGLATVLDADYTRFIWDVLCEKGAANLVENMCEGCESKQVLSVGTSMHWPASAARGSISQLGLSLQCATLLRGWAKGDFGDQAAREECAVLPRWALSILSWRTPMRSFFVNGA
eukprot:SAG11_NODE_2774_length_2985_cov_1.774428_5_plen_123_part_00